MAAQPHQPSPYPVPSPAVVVLTGVDTAGEQFFVLGLDVVVENLAPYSVLAYARTSGEARVDATAAALLADQLDEYVETDMEPDEKSLYDAHAGDSRPFDADGFFGGEWTPCRPIVRLPQYRVAARAPARAVRATAP